MNAYSYTFQDDNKAQEETCNGNVVHGSYSLIELDGSRRTVSYAADPINGFNAVVQRDQDITVKTIAVAAPLPAATLCPVIAATAPAAVTIRPESCCKILHVAENVKMHARTFIMQAIVVDAPLLRQSFIYGSTLAATNVAVANSGLVGLGESLGVRSRSLYGAQTVASSRYGSGNVVKIHQAA
ncbi:Cuticle protein [Trachymyrmex cornetzi]|uniref:Cuticle protein n=1 Tax=Trachymyrmex cornetzi TaxID=471704 RepID=A0A151J2X4_9HYME|nr:Cuticle protein [Trachymyrmex cornetzi]